MELLQRHRQAMAATQAAAEPVDAIKKQADPTKEKPRWTLPKDFVEQAEKQFLEISKTLKIV